MEVDPPCPVTLPFSEQCDWLHQNIRVVKANPAFAAMYGVENPDELIGLGSADVHVADSEKNAAFIPTIVKHGYRCHNLETEELGFLTDSFGLPLSQEKVPRFLWRFLCNGKPNNGKPNSRAGGR